MKEAVRAWVRDNTRSVRAIVGALLVIGGQFVPGLTDLAGSDLAVTTISGAIVVALGADVAREAKRRK